MINIKYHSSMPVILYGPTSELRRVQLFDENNVFIAGVFMVRKRNFNGSVERFYMIESEAIDEFRAIQENAGVLK